VGRQYVRLVWDFYLIFFGFFSPFGLFLVSARPSLTRRAGQPQDSDSGCFFQEIFSFQFPPSVASLSWIFLVVPGYYAFSRSGGLYFPFLFVLAFPGGLSLLLKDFLPWARNSYFSPSPELCFFLLFFGVPFLTSSVSCAFFCSVCSPLLSVT